MRLKLYQKVGLNEKTEWTWFGFIKRIYDEDLINLLFVFRSPFTSLQTYTDPIKYENEFNVECRKVYVFHFRWKKRMKVIMRTSHYFTKASLHFTSNLHFEKV